MEQQIRAQQLDYAARLAPYNHKGIMGTAEQADTRRLLTTKVKKLAELVRKAKHVVVHTGAGISTSAGIPDFRGPKGVWTLEKEGAKKRKAGAKEGVKQEKNQPVQWANAKPTATHMCLVGMHRAGRVRACLSKSPRSTSHVLPASVYYLSECRWAASSVRM
jgi:mono-ADP-ribosyltransferase sirtuin 6